MTRPTQLTSLALRSAAAAGFANDRTFDSFLLRLAGARKGDGIFSTGDDGSAIVALRGDVAAGHAMTSRAPTLTEPPSQLRINSEARTVPASGGALHSEELTYLEATYLMQRLSSCRECVGVQFVGVTMTIQKAISLGTLIAMMLRYATSSLMDIDDDD